MPVVRWKFTEVRNPAVTYTFHINPNTATSPSSQKQMNVASAVGPSGPAILQEGNRTAPEMTFGGVILEQAHLETLEAWYHKRVLLEMEDDLGRQYQGVLSLFNPTRERRPYRPWFHRYEATFLVSAHRSASGIVVYGHFANA